MGNIAKIDRAATAPAPRSLQPPNWPSKLTDWLRANRCIRREWTSDGSRYFEVFHAPETIPADIRALAEELSSRYSVAVQWAPRRQILAMLARLAVHFPDQRSAAEWKIIHEDYADALAEMPADVIAEAVRLYLLKGRFYPKLAELMAEAQPLLTQRRNEFHWLMELEGTETPEERAERWERERAEREAKRLAEIEARCQEKPCMRPYYKWAQQFRRHLSAIQWIGWLEEQSQSHSAEEIERWHQQLADEQAAAPWPADFDAFARLRAIAREHGAKPDTDIPW